MSSKNLAKQRIRLWKTNPHCHYCGVRTILKSVGSKAEWLALSVDERSRVATIDHLRARHHPDRQKRPREGEILHVLACSKCNNERDRQQLAQKPKEWHHKQSNSFPLSQRSTAELTTINALLSYKSRRERRHGISEAKKKSQIMVAWELWERGIDQLEEEANDQNSTKS